MKSSGMKTAGDTNDEGSSAKVVINGDDLMSSSSAVSAPTSSKVNNGNAIDNQAGKASTNNAGGHKKDINSTNVISCPFDEARADTGGLASGSGGGGTTRTTTTAAFTSKMKQIFKSNTNGIEDGQRTSSTLSSTPSPLPTITQAAASLATEPPTAAAATATSLAENHSDSSYFFTTPPRRSIFFFLRHPLSFALQLREFRHTSCLMTPISTFVLLVILLSSFLSALLTFPQLIIGILLGPIVQRKFWLVQFLYRSNIAKWGHLKLFTMAAAQSNKNKKSSSSTPSTSGSTSNATTKNLLQVEDSHSQTLHQRINVVPNRVYIHPIPQFMDNIAYLIVCTPPTLRDKTTTSSAKTVSTPPQPSASSSSASSSSLPIIAILIDCGESTKIIQHMENIYEHYYSHDFPRRRRKMRSTDNSTSATLPPPEPPQLPAIELLGIFCTHRHHDHTAGVGPLIEELTKRRLSLREMDEENADIVVSAGCSISSSNNTNTNVNNQNTDIYKQSPGNIVVVGGAVEHVPHCNVFVKNGCFVPLPCVAQTSSSTSMMNDMNDILSMEVIGVPSHTRGSVVYALRNRMAPNIVSILPTSTSQQQQQQQLPPLQTHLFTGDTIFTGGSGVPFESDLQFRRDDFIKSPAALKGKHGSSKFRPGAGMLSMERCFVEVLTRAVGPWSKVHSSAEISQSQESVASTTLLYPGHEYTTFLMMRQLDQKALSAEISWSKTSPSSFFEVASHYLVSAHRRDLLPEQRILTVPTPLEKEMVVNPNFRVLKRRGECVVDALRLWYEYGSKNLLSPRVADDVRQEQPRRQQSSVFTTVYSDHLSNVVKELRSGKLDAMSAADQIESLTSALDEKLIGRRPIPGTLPSHKNVYLGVVALAILGSAPSAVTVSDGTIMNLAIPVDSTDRLVISKTRVRARFVAISVGIFCFIYSADLCFHHTSSSLRH